MTGRPAASLSKEDIRRLFELLDAELGAEDAQGELYLVGGAVMCLTLDARESTLDVDAFFRPTRLVREAARRVAAKTGVPDKWLNDAVKGFLSPRGSYQPYIDLPNLKVFVARPEYLLAMKCVAVRLGEEFHDLDDLRFLLRYLDISTVEEALSVVTRYFDERHLLPKTRLVLEELLAHRPNRSERRKVAPRPPDRTGPRGTEEVRSPLAALEQGGVPAGA